MKRRAFLSLLPAALVLSANAAFANPFSDNVVAQLTKQGFSGITAETTWLGRIRILAQRKDGLREIVLNPRTGEILRDTWTANGGISATAPIVDDVGGHSENASGSNSGNGSGNEGGDDGASNSGSGNNSGSGSNTGGGTNTGISTNSGSGSASGSGSGGDSGSGSGSGSGKGSGSGSGGNGGKSDDKGKDN